VGRERGGGRGGRWEGEGKRWGAQTIEYHAFFTVKCLWRLTLDPSRMIDSIYMREHTVHATYKEKKEKKSKEVHFTVTSGGGGGGRGIQTTANQE
jgi:hypothetical protein